MGLSLKPSGRDEVDVLIIGAGPAGLMASLWMAELGVKARIIDKNGTRTLHGKADGMNVRSMEIWESFNMIDTVLKHGFAVNEWCLWCPDKYGDLHRRQRKCAIGTESSRFSIGMMHQGHIEATMIDAIRKRNGPEVERGTIPTSIEIDDSGSSPQYPVKVGIRRLRREELPKWTSNSHIVKPDGTRKAVEADIAFPTFPDDENDIVDTISGEEGSTATVYAKYVVGADGAHSWVRQKLGLEVSGSTEEATWAVLDLRSISNFPDIRKNCTIQSEDGTLLMIPREKGMTRVYTTLTEDVAKKKDAFDHIFSKVKKIMSPYRFDYNYCDWWTTYQVSQRVCKSFSYKDRVYLAGDAVHTHTPKGGQGMNLSIQDAYNLGWKLAMVLKGHAGKELLATYELERRPVAQALIDMDNDLSRVLRSTASQVGVNATRKIYNSLRDYGSGANIRYQPSTVSVNALGPSGTNLQVGKRFPSFRVYNQATGTPVEVQQLLKSDGRWRLIVFAGLLTKRLQLEHLNEFGERLRHLLERYPLRPNRKPFLEVLLVHSSPDGELEINDLHQTFFSFNADEGFDYERVFTRITDGPHEELRSSVSRPSVSFGEKCLVVVRPDQHVGWIGRPSEYDLLENYFDGFMIPRDKAFAR